MKLYHHKTSGGAEYLMDTFIPWKHNGKSGKEGVMNSKTKYLVRIDGDITKDAELDVRDEKPSLKATTKRQHNALMDALNLIDEQAEHAGVSYDEEVARGKAYEKLADFIYKCNKQ